MHTFNGWTMTNNVRRL